jgi:hypothetical protein
MPRDRHDCTGLPATVIMVSLLLGGCTTGAPHSTQSMVPGALVDPVLEPLRGCEALRGEWANRGYEIKENRTKVAILSAALGLADELPDTAFADRVRFELQDDGSLLLTAMEKHSALGSVSVPASDIRCEATDARLAAPARMELAVDTQGALWINRRHGLLAIPYRYRFMSVGEQIPDCTKQLPNCRPGMQRMPTPSGMAMVVAGAGDLNAAIRKVDDRLEMLMVQDEGVAAWAQAAYLLPGPHRFDMLAWTPGNYWTARPQTRLSTEVTLEACHVYVPVGSHEEGGMSWATLIDLGKGFDIACVGTPTAPRTEIRFSADQRKLLVAEHCYAEWGESAGFNAPPREFLLPQPPP